MRFTAEHVFVGSGEHCEKCYLLPSEHRKRNTHKFQGTGHTCSRCGGLPHEHRDVREAQKKAQKQLKTHYVGIDGEGQGRKDHRYVMLCANDETGYLRSSTSEVTSSGRLTTADCLEFILNLPADAQVFAYAFQYDLTKICMDLPDREIYRLFRPEVRRRHPSESHIPTPHPVRYYCKENRKCYFLNLQGTKFTVREGKRRKVVWDVFKFYQSRFTKALTDWKVGEKAVVDRIQHMKEQRSEFDKLGRDAIREYCFEECQFLAQLVRKLVTAHAEAGLTLKTFYGAGSTGGLILKGMGIDKCNRKTPEGMEDAVSKSFFGGRFENRVIGQIDGRLWGYDISSAYPYQTRFLPCLDHAKWSHTTDYKTMTRARHALVKYGLHRSAEWNELSWGPFPWRDPEGTICFPGSSGGGWVWREEYLAGERIFSGVEFKEAWILEGDCDCVPFSRIPEFYLQRIKLGKEGAGIVLKLGPNSVYGKLAQSLGAQPPYQCWIWASMITSGTRAMILDLIGLHKDKHAILGIATDGIYTREKLETPGPKDTGTFFKLDGKPNPKPLGGWEEKQATYPIFFARPGIYFEMLLSGTPTMEELDPIVRARGIGRAVLAKNALDIKAAWMRGEGTVTLDRQLDRFIGAKTGTWKAGYNKDTRYIRSGDYGQWVQRSVKLSLSPMPKRDRIVEIERDIGQLSLRHTWGESAPYSRAVARTNMEALLLQMAEQEATEQPDGELGVYDLVSAEGYWQ